MAKLMQFADCLARLQRTYVYILIHLLSSGGARERARQLNCLFNIDFRDVYFYCDSDVF